MLRRHPFLITGCVILAAAALAMWAGELPAVLRTLIAPSYLFVLAVTMVRVRLLGPHLDASVASALAWWIVNAAAALIPWAAADSLLALARHWRSRPSGESRSVASAPSVDSAPSDQ